MRTTRETMMEYFEQLNTGDFEKVVPLFGLRPDWTERVKK